MTFTTFLFGALQILGSLGVFLYGMKVMSEGIQKTAGHRLRQIMETMTQNRVAGLLTGFLITCLVQSSSATTVIVVSFVNAGLLTLVESIGVIMGANLGTTLTAWIIAFVGKFSLSTWALPIIGVGLPLFFIGKGKSRTIGEVLIGFGLLFFGLSLLKDSVPDVKSLLKSDDPNDIQAVESIRAFVTQISGYGFLSVILFLLFGVVLTLVVQSSSAAMAITVTFSLNGWIDFPMGAAIVLGENIGTTVTAYLAALGANVNARRAARAHFAFNVIGVLWILPIFLWLWVPMIEWFGDHLWPVAGSKAQDSQIGFNLALHHSMFNFANICLLIGFVPLLAKLVEGWVKSKPGEGTAPRLTYISQSMVDVGELNLPEAQNAVLDMAKLTGRMFSGFREVFSNPNVDLSDKVTALKQMEEQSDRMTADITHYLVHTSSAEISDDNATVIGGMMRIVSHLEEVADCIYKLVKLAERKYNEHREFTPDTLRALDEFCGIVTETIDFYTEKLFTKTTIHDIRNGDRLETTLDEMRRALNEEAVNRMQSGGDVRSEMLSIDINNHLEKIGNHSLNILEENHNMAEALD